MAPDQARRIVLGAIAVAGISAAINDATKRKGVPSARIAIGAGIAAAVLAAASDVAPTVAALLALSLAVTSLLDGGTATARFVTAATAPKKP